MKIPDPPKGVISSLHPAPKGTPAQMQALHELCAGYLGRVPTRQRFTKLLIERPDAIGPQLDQTLNEIASWTVDGSINGKRTSALRNRRFGSWQEACREIKVQQNACNVRRLNLETTLSLEQLRTWEKVQVLMDRAEDAGLVADAYAIVEAGLIAVKKIEEEKARYQQTTVRKMCIAYVAEIERRTAMIDGLSKPHSSRCILFANGLIELWGDAILDKQTTVEAKRQLVGLARRPPKSIQRDTRQPGFEGLPVDLVLENYQKHIAYLRAICNWAHEKQMCSNKLAKLLPYNWMQDEDCPPTQEELALVKKHYHILDTDEWDDEADGDEEVRDFIDLTVLDPDVAKIWMETVELLFGGALVIVSVLCLFCGLRTSEAKRVARKPSLLVRAMRTGKLVLPARLQKNKAKMLKKGIKKRVIPLEGPAMAFLSRYFDPENPPVIWPKGAGRRGKDLDWRLPDGTFISNPSGLWSALRTHLGIGRNAFRHSFCASRLFELDSYPKLAKEAGHTVPVLVRYYDAYYGVEDAAKVRGIRPQYERGKSVDLASVSQAVRTAVQLGIASQTPKRRCITAAAADLLREQPKLTTAALAEKLAVPPERRDSFCILANNARKSLGIATATMRRKSQLASVTTWLREDSALQNAEIAARLETRIGVAETLAAKARKALGIVSPFARLGDQLDGGQPKACRAAETENACQNRAISA